MKKPFFNVLLALITTVFISCEKDNSDVVALLIPPSDGQTQTLSGGTGGLNAVNAVYVDMSTSRQDSVLRSSWDLGFYSGSDFRVVLNNTTSAGAKVTAKNDLAQVGAADTVGLTLATSQMSPAATDFAYFDDLSGSIAQTVIPAVSANDAENKVIILNRGTGGGVAARPWIKLRVLRNANGYTLQYARITETAYQTIIVPKDAAYNFKFISLNNGAVIKVEPKKTEWDIQWSYAMYKANFNGVEVPYNFSDLITINTLGGVMAAEVLTSTVAYADYSEANVATTAFSNNRWVIGSNWRATTGTIGVKGDRFYVVKDPAGNVYKLKFISFHASDGGVRGYPVIEYKLVRIA